VGGSSEQRRREGLEAEIEKLKAERAEHQASIERKKLALSMARVCH
jgi:hypothetical protein